MNRREFVASALCACAVRSAFAGVSTSVQADIDAIHTALFNAQCLCCVDKEAICLIERIPYLPSPVQIDTAPRTSSHGHAMAPFPDATLLPTEAQRDDAEALTRAFSEQLNVTPVPVSTTLTINTPHLFVTEEESRQYFLLYGQGNVYDPGQVERARQVPANIRQRFQHAHDVWAVTPVAFHPAKPLALAGFRSRGGSCMSERFAVFGKTDGTWRSAGWEILGKGECA